MKLTQTHYIIAGAVAFLVIALVLYATLGGTPTSSKVLTNDFGTGNTIGTLDQSEKNTTDNSKKVESSVDTSSKTSSSTTEGN